MKLLYYFILAITFSGTCKAPKSIKKDDDSSTTYLLETKLFLNDVYQKEFKNPSLILVNQPSISCIDNLTKDSFFSAEEKAQIKTESKAPKIERWEKVIPLKIRYIERDTINKIFDSKRTEDGWSYFYENIGHGGFNTISAPIFLRNYTYCLFYSSNSCGWLCGTGNLELYKKVKGKWVLERNFCSWIS